MTAAIAMIPIDCKITKFSLYATCLLLNCADLKKECTVYKTNIKVYNSTKHF